MSDINNNNDIIREGMLLDTSPFEDDMETGTFGLPLKTHHDSKPNFCELEENINGWASLPGSRSITPININNHNADHIMSTRPKRVRFHTHHLANASLMDETGSSSNNLMEESRSSSNGLMDDARYSCNSSHISLASRRSQSAMSTTSSFSILQPKQHSKRSVEQLLFTASELNAYVEKNKDNIKPFHTQVMNNDSFYNSMSNLSSPIMDTKNNELVSKFSLMDLEDDSEEDDTLDYNRFITTSPVNDFLSRSRSPINLDLSLNDENDDEAHSKKYNFETDIDIDDETLGKAILQRVQLQQTTYCQNSCHLLECTCFPLLNDNLISSTDLIPHTIEESINNFIETITIILKLSKNEDNQELLPREHRKFLMKTTPSLSFQDFIKRIQSKCELNPTIYLCATYLLQCLFLCKEESTNEEGNAPPCLKLKRDMTSNGVHRLIIALIRISCKILEDQLYSHEYMSKVCGVSKRLLTQLEASLMTCLKNQNLLITIKKLNASLAILSEMRSICPE